MWPSVPAWAGAASLGVPPWLRRPDVQSANVVASAGWTPIVEPRNSVATIPCGLEPARPISVGILSVAKGRRTPMQAGEAPATSRSALPRRRARTTLFRSRTDQSSGSTRGTINPCAIGATR